MCVVAFAWDTHPRWRLVLAGNRDEFHARPTAALARWPASGLIAGRDLQSGGTWVGLDGGGRVAVVTNVRDGLAQPHDGPSRGALPLALLGSRADAVTTARALQARAADYAPFNLMLADTVGCWHVGNHPPQREPLAAGVHGISNGRLDAPWPKTLHLRAALGRWLESGSDALQPLWDALADERMAPDHALPDTGVGIELERRLSPAFIRGPAYGTRASTIIAVDHQGRGFIHERRFGPEGVFEGETVVGNDV
ncbi:MAG: NRDE family protein [Lysobacteraceae bacterium]|nr:MAG: NRDE family protein [Xanthomonadaceae bacterium]